MKAYKCMHYKIISIIIIFFSSFQKIICERCGKYGKEFYINDKDGPFTNTGLSCGKKNPKKQEDCTKYGTDSGMYCCWVARDENDNNGKCYLISEKKIERSGIDGCAQFIESYWSCGNYSEKSATNLIIHIIMMGFLFL